MLNKDLVVFQGMDSHLSVELSKDVSLKDRSIFPGKVYRSLKTFNLGVFTVFEVFVRTSKMPKVDWPFS